MLGLVVVGLIFEEISNINVKCVKGTGVQNIGQGHQVIVQDIWKGNVKGVKVNGARNIGQGHRVKLPAESVH